MRRSSFILLCTVIAALALSCAVAFAGPQKYVDEPNVYTLKLAPDSYLTLNSPKRLFQVGKNEIDGHPAVRQGWGLGFTLCAHPTARGSDAAIYVEVLGHTSLFPGDPKDVKLAKWTDDYVKRLGDTISVRAMELQGEPLKPSKVKFTLGTRNVDALLVAYNVKPMNGLPGITAKPAVAKAWVMDIDNIRVVITAEAMKELFDPASVVEKAFTWSKKPPKAAKQTFKMIDTTYYVYRYMNFELPENFEPIYGDGDEMGVLAAWNILNDKGERVGVLRFNGLYIEDKPLTEHAVGYTKVTVGGATFYELRDRTKWITTLVAKDPTGMMWKWTIQAFATPDVKALIKKFDEMNTEAKEATKRIHDSAMDALEAPQYLLIHEILKTVQTWAVKG